MRWWDCGCHRVKPTGPGDSSTMDGQRQERETGGGVRSIANSHPEGIRGKRSAIRSLVQSDAVAGCILGLVSVSGMDCTALVGGIRRPIDFRAFVGPTEAHLHVDTRRAFPPNWQPPGGWTLQRQDPSTRLRRAKRWQCVGACPSSDGSGTRPVAIKQEQTERHGVRLASQGHLTPLCGRRRRLFDKIDRAEIWFMGVCPVAL